jgi:toxin secretion/phage lysis holin
MQAYIEVLQSFRFRNEWWVLILPISLMAIDVVTGLLKAFVTKTFQSSVLRAGGCKKAGEVAVLGVGELFTCALVLPDYVMIMVSAYIVFMEIMSIIENVDKLGVPIPAFVRDVVNNVDDQLTNRHLSDAEIKEIKELIEKNKEA